MDDLGYTKIIYDPRVFTRVIQVLDPRSEEPGKADTWACTARLITTRTPYVFREEYCGVRTIVHIRIDACSSHPLPLCKTKCLLEDRAINHY